MKNIYQTAKRIGKTALVTGLAALTIGCGEETKAPINDNVPIVEDSTTPLTGRDLFLSTNHTKKYVGLRADNEIVNVDTTSDGGIVYTFNDRFWPSLLAYGPELEGKYRNSKNTVVDADNNGFPETHKLEFEGEKEFTWYFTNDESAVDVMLVRPDSGVYSEKGERKFVSPLIF
ncbi:MAG: hypothetical protein ABIH59_02195 [archaeon]